MTIEKFCENYGKTAKLVDALQNLSRVYKPAPRCNKTAGEFVYKVRPYLARSHYRVYRPRRRLRVIKGGKVA